MVTYIIDLMMLRYHYNVEINLKCGGYFPGLSPHCLTMCLRLVPMTSPWLVFYILIEFNGVTLVNEIT